MKLSDDGGVGGISDDGVAGVDVTTVQYEKGENEEPEDTSLR